MKSSIKLKNNSILLRLIDSPPKLAALIEIAFHTDEDLGGAYKTKIKANKKAIDSLIFEGIIFEEENKYFISDKRVVNFTLKKKLKTKEELEGTLLIDVLESTLTIDQRNYFNIAKAFRDLFKENLESAGGRTLNVENATYKKWVDPIRLMMENDKVTREQLLSVYKFLKESDFWRLNVQSTQKLREKFQTIHSQTKGNGSNKKPSSDNNGKGARTISSERKDF